jgi:hypothetical protein
LSTTIIKEIIIKIISSNHQFLIGSVSTALAQQFNTINQIIALNLNNILFTSLSDIIITHYGKNASSNFAQSFERKFVQIAY